MKKKKEKQRRHSVKSSFFHLDNVKWFLFPLLNVL